MYCLNNIDRLTINNETIIRLLYLYEYKGKDFYYENVLKSNLAQITRQTIERDTFYIGKLMGLNISNNHKKLLIKKESENKKLNEKMLRNIKNVLKIISEKSEEFVLSSNEMLHLGIRLYKEVKNISYKTVVVEYQNNLLTEKKKESLRKKMDDLLNEYSKLVYSKKYELTQLVTNFYIDLINLNVFSDGNEFIALISIYILLLKEKFKMFKYVSFFEMIYDRYDEFKAAVLKANFNWKEGFSQTNDLNLFIVDLLLNGYGKVDKLASDTEFDSKIKKSYNIENTIMKLGEVFTKEEIREKHPYVSMSTIDRTLKRMRDENKIRPNGVGRNASWIKLVDYERFEATPSRQLSLYDLMMNDDEN